MPLLVWIFHESLVFWHNSAHDGVIARLQGVLHVVVAFSDGRDGSVNLQRDRAPGHPFPVTHPGHDVKRTVDGYGYDGQLQLVGEHEGTAPEHAHVPRKRSRTFWKNHQRHLVF